MVGMRDVARKAGVSLSTVSLVVNGTGYVSAEMRGRVEAAMRELDYIPNELARNLYSGRTSLIGVIVPTIRHPFFSTLTASLQRAFAARGLRTMLCSTADAEGGEVEYVDMLRRRMMDGIVMGAHTSHAPGYWTSIGRPVVAFDRYLGEGIASVGSDHEQGGRLVADLLVRTGTRHVVTLGGPRAQFHDLQRWMAEHAAIGGGDGPASTFPTVRYHLTLERELRAAGTVHEYLEAGEVHDMQAYAQAARVVCARAAEGQVDAIVSSDVGAAFCVQEALRLGLRIPEDLQIVAYDGTYLAQAAGLRVTAVRQDFDAIADTIAGRMDDAIAGGLWSRGACWRWRHGRCGGRDRHRWG
ncbi:LacI family sucrose operon transcriptional repressor [Bifidobacterium pullorum]|uniref:LacI family sucrose operon transcriptional repressor n=1 Tax=Bifidobacterium pullorum TaxID=78448 RepID=A0A7V8KR63_9BIFI|nr:LacI family sucrose operon transcriptional repressor [Bifidobacterium pullorum]